MHASRFTVAIYRPPSQLHTQDHWSQMNLDEPMPVKLKVDAFLENIKIGNIFSKYRGALEWEIMIFQ